MNELLWVAMLLANFLAILLVYRTLGKTGLFVWIPISAILANIQVLKTVELFGLTATLGNIIYATSFLCTDILSENYGKSEARKGVFVGFFSILVMTALMNLALVFVPAEGDFAQGALVTIFKPMIRVAIGSLAAYLVSQLHDVHAYDFWRRKLPANKYLFVRNNASTMVSQLLDSLVFTVIAFWGEMPFNVLVEIFITTYLFKWIVAACDTPFLYWAKSWHKKVEAEESKTACQSV